MNSFENFLSRSATFHLFPLQCSLCEGDDGMERCNQLKDYIKTLRASCCLCSNEITTQNLTVIAK